MADLQSLRMSAVFLVERRLAPDERASVVTPLPAPLPLATEAKRSLVPTQLHESISRSAELPPSAYMSSSSSSALAKKRSVAGLTDCNMSLDLDDAGLAGLLLYLRPSPSLSLSAAA